MPWFYFHVCDDKEAVPDRDGKELADTGQALKEGERFAREILAQHLKENCAPEKRRIEVRNEAGEVIGIFRFKDLLR